MAEQIAPQVEAVVAQQTPPNAPGKPERFYFVVGPGRETPLDELTGLPLPIVPEDTYEKSEWHHHFHPKNSDILLNSVGGKALRTGRLQLVNYDTHHYGYHHHFDGPKLASTPEEQLAHVIMMASGYIPRHALNFDNKKPRVVRMKKHQRDRLQMGGEIKSVDQGATRDFITDCVLNNEISDINVNESVIEEFLTTENLARKKELGHNLIGRMVTKSTEPVQPTYTEARKRFFILPGLPKSVVTFAKSRMGSTRHQNIAIEELRRRTAAALGYS